MRGLSSYRLAKPLALPSATCQLPFCPATLPSTKAAVRYGERKLQSIKIKGADG